MKTRLILSIYFLLHICLTSFAQPEYQLWYKQPAAEWNEALPIGNGRLGAMVFGDTDMERLQLNEESIWTGSRNLVPDKEGAAEVLPIVRKMLFEGRYAEAQEKVEKEMMVDGAWTMYQMLADLWIQTGHKNAVNYKRALDLQQAMAHVNYETDGVKYSREYFSSYPGQCLVIRLSASEKKKISISTCLTRPKDANVVVAGHLITMKGQVTSGDANTHDLLPGVNYESWLKVKNIGGQISISGDSILIKNADEVILFLVAASNYWEDDPAVVCAERLQKIENKAYEEIKKEHIASHQLLFNRVTLNLGKGFPEIPTDKRLEALKGGQKDMGLLNLYFQYGRYMLICSSRPGDLAANLQGIWADGLIPPWSADYHININIQMNYWPAEVTNLSECHLPFISLMDSLRRSGRQTARNMYGCEGFVAHYTTDAWYWTTAQGKAEWGMWPMGAAWGCEHLWEHYAYHPDKEYLAYAYDIVKEASLFYTQYLTTDPKTGYLVTGPSTSPENKLRTPDGKVSNLTMGPSMDMQIINELFTNTIAASQILEVDADFRQILIKMKAQLAPIQIGSDGRIMEWTEAFGEPEPGHRHISHLYGLYPGNQISLIQTPELAKAARKTIDYRLSHGGGHTGWSRAWIINFFARLGDGEKAYENLEALLTHSTLSNLFDNHPPFQIDGNFGGTAGIAEMLLQSQAGEIELLPALPGVWQEGYVNGLRARGGVEVNLTWKNGELENALLITDVSGLFNIRYKDEANEVYLKKGKKYELNEKLEIIEEL